MPLSAFFCCVLLTFYVACGSTSSPVSEDTVGSDSIALPDVPACEVEPTITSLATEYFEKSCNFGSCHGEGKAGGLDLRPDAAYDALMNAPAQNAAAAGAGKMLVVPGDPDASYLVQKVEGPEEGEGGIMPLNAPEPVNPDCWIKRLREWIANGANP